MEPAALLCLWVIRHIFLPFQFRYLLLLVVVVAELPSTAVMVVKEAEAVLVRVVFIQPHLSLRKELTQ
jgi:hypothetical protein